MAIGKKLRFEVFKRDKFTCQYCGRKAPDVVLNADHIEPVAEGGTDDILNLTTSCFDCNSGKGKRRLDDDSVVEKQRAQLEALQERQEQIRMMIEWQRSLVDMDGEAVDAAAGFWAELTGFFLTETGRGKLRSLIKKFGLEESLEAMRASTHYLEATETGVNTLESVEVAFDKIGGICVVRRAEKENPALREAFMIRGIIRKRLSYIKEWEAKDILEIAVKLGADSELLRAIAYGNSTWTAWRSEMVELLDRLCGEEADVA